MVPEVAGKEDGRLRASGAVDADAAEAGCGLSGVVGRVRCCRRRQRCFALSRRSRPQRRHAFRGSGLRQSGRRVSPLESGAGRRGSEVIGVCVVRCEGPQCSWPVPPPVVVGVVSVVVVVAAGSAGPVVPGDAHTETCSLVSAPRRAAPSAVRRASARG